MSSNLNETAKAGFTYLVEVISPDGTVRDSETVHNLVPAEGLNYILGAATKGVTQTSNWYVGAYEGNYTPVGTDTAATFVASATESTAYSETVRQTLTLGTVSAGAADNSASPAQFTFTANKTIYGGFISSSAAKGGTTGTLLSAVKFASAKTLAADDILQITAGFALTSS